jgi:hypothetical protein
MKLLLFTLLTAHCSLITLPAQQAQPLTPGTITRFSDGSTATTTRYGHGTRTVITRPGTPSRSFTTTRYGHGSITRTSDGRTAITSRYGLTKQPGKFSPQSRKSR